MAGMVRQTPVEFFDLAESQEFAEFFAIARELTGILVALVDPSGVRMKRLFPSAAENPLCRLIQSRAPGKAACNETDRINCERAARARHGIQYLCHAGLVDIAVPIFVDDRHAATINCGQVLPEPPSEEGFQRLCVRLHTLRLPAQQLRDTYFASPFLPKGKLEQTLHLLVFFAEYCCEMGRRLRAHMPSGERAEIEQAKRYLHRHFREALTLQEVAQRVSLSPAYFSSLFKAETGETFVEHVQRLRVEEAKGLLRGTTVPVTDIALQVGFNNLTHFTRVFRKYEECAPGRYRTRVKGKDGR